MSNYQLFQNDLPSKVLKSFKGDISIDTETLGLNIKRDRLCLIQLRNETDKKIYLIKFEEDLSPNRKSVYQDVDMSKITMKKKVGGPLRPIPAGNKGLPKLPKPVRNKMGFMKKGGKIQKRAGGGVALRGFGATRKI